MIKKDRNFGEWVFMFPISNLSLTSAVKNEFKLGDVTFITFKKFNTNKKKFGVIRSLNIIKNDDVYRDLLNKHFETVALVKFNGEKSHAQKKAERAVNDKLLILAISQLFYKQNGNNPKPYVFKSDIHGFMNFDFNINSQEIGMSSEMRGTLHPLTLNQEWLDINKKHFFFGVQRLFDKSEKDFNEWERSLYRSLILAGKSIYDEDIGQAFLFRMIAIEAVITGSSKHKETFIGFFNLLIGWHKDWESKHMEQKMSDIYKKRTDYVHDGNPENINKEDLLFTEFLLFNLYNNIFNNFKYFSSKQELKETVEKHKAVVTLGLEKQRHKFLPQGLTYTFQYTSEPSNCASKIN